MDCLCPVPPLICGSARAPPLPFLWSRGQGPLWVSVGREAVPQPRCNSPGAPSPQESEDAVKALAKEKDLLEREKWELRRQAKEATDHATALRSQLDLKDNRMKELEAELAMVRPHPPLTQLGHPRRAAGDRARGQGGRRRGCGWARGLLSAQVDR